MQPEEPLKCFNCKQLCEPGLFSKTQLRKREHRRCRECIETNRPPFDENALRLVLAPPRALSALQDIIGYKVVTLNVGNGLSMDALLHLRMTKDASIYHIEGRSGIAALSELVPGTKYCTNLAFVDALEIIAPNPGMKNRALLALQVKPA
jgi:hypothetical protein